MIFTRAVEKKKQLPCIVNRIIQTPALGKKYKASF